MTSNLENATTSSIEDATSNCKNVIRRSSLFRSQSIEFYTRSDQPLHFEDLKNLEKEDLEWKVFYVELKEKYKKLRKTVSSEPSNQPDPVLLLHVDSMLDYASQINEFLEQMNIVKKLVEAAINKRNQSLEKHFLLQDADITLLLNNFR